jgi:hypothetical protein
MSSGNAPVYWSVSEPSSGGYGNKQSTTIRGSKQAPLWMFVNLSFNDLAKTFQKRTQSR